MPAPDKLGRGNPRASVTGFLQACRRQKYDLASQYLDLSAGDKSRGPELARKLETTLNSASHFSVLDLTRNSEGSSPGGATTPPGARRRHRAKRRNVHTRLERVALEPGGPSVWLFSPETGEGGGLEFEEPHCAGALVVHHLPGFMTRLSRLKRRFGSGWP